MTATPGAPVTVDQVLQIHTHLLAGGADQKSRREADHWLRDFQKTVANDKFIQIEYDLYQLADLQSRVSLRDNLISLLHKYRAGPKSMIIQLALSTADLAIQMEEWNTPVEQLVQAFGKDPEMVACLLEFLSLLPEEIMYNRKIKLEREQLLARATILLTKPADEICALLLHYLQVAGTSQDILEGVFRTFRSWLKSRDMRIESLTGTPVVEYAFSALNDPNLFEVAADVITAMIGRSVSKPIDQNLIQGLYTRIAPILKMLDEDKDDFEKMKALTLIFAEAGEVWVNFIVEDPMAFSVVVEGLLKCAGCEDLDVVRETFQFWFLLADEVLVASENGGAGAAKRAAFADVFRRVLDIMIKHEEYPEDCDTMSAEARDEFRDFRHTMGDVLKDCVRVLGPADALSRPVNLLSSYFTSQTSTSVGSLNTSISWQKIEAPLFSLRTMAREVGREENDVMLKVMAMLPHLPQHPKIKYAAIMVIGRYAEWTNAHPETVEYQLQYVSTGFAGDEETKGAAALSLKYLCQYCGQHMVKYLEQLHPFYLETVKSLEKEERREFTEAIAHVVNSLETEKILAAMQTFVLPVAQRLHEIANLGKVGSEEEEVRVVREATDLVDQFSLFIRVIRPTIDPQSPHPCVIVLQGIWPVLDGLLTTYSTARRLYQAMCRVFVFSMESYRHHLGPLLGLIMTKVVEMFHLSGEACWLWVAKKCVNVFGDDDGGGVEAGGNGNGKVVLEVVGQMTGTTFGIINSKGVGEVPDVIEDFFSLLISLTDSSPTLFLTTPNLASSTFQCALACLETNQREPLIQSLVYLDTLITFTDPATSPTPLPAPLTEPLTAMIVQEMDKLVGALVKGLC
ncbi:Nuclear import receptor, partial [Rhizophlyctis rosea]